MMSAQRSFFSTTKRAGLPPRRWSSDDWDGRIGVSLRPPASGVGVVDASEFSGVLQRQEGADGANVERAENWEWTNLLARDIQVKGGGTIKVGQVMQDLIVQLGKDKKISAKQLQGYVNKGEDIVKRVVTNNVQLPATLEDVIAVSWYLQAKAVFDNSGDRRAATMSRGTMVMQDPENKLYNFLNSAEEAYGRPSSHFAARSGDDNSTRKNVGYVSAKRFGGKAQRGIEDYQGRMPGGGGTLLFGRLKPSKDKGPPELFLKWETVGVPPVFWKNGKRIFPNFCNLIRVIRHGRKLGKSSTVHHHRGEKPTSAPTKVLLENYTRIVAGGDKTLKKQAEVEGIDYMIAETEKLIAKTSRLDGEIEQNDLLNQLKKFKQSMGADFGITRKGAEIHLQLPETPQNAQIGVDGGQDPEDPDPEDL